jgi:hypothetical protein
MDICEFQMMKVKENIQYIRLWYLFTFLCYAAFLFLYSIILEQVNYQIFEFLFATLVWPVYMFYLTLIDIFLSQNLTLPNIILIGLPISTFTFIIWFKKYSEDRRQTKNGSKYYPVLK